MKKNTIIIAVCLCVLFNQATFASELSRKIDSVVYSKKLSKVTFGVNVAEASTGKVVYSHNSSKPMIPASNMKIISSASALHHLGTDYAFKTTVYTNGSDLIIVGSGDPLLGDEVYDTLMNRKSGWLLDAILASVKAAGIKEVTDVIIDSSVFDDNLVHPSWPSDQLNRYYACQVAGLNYNQNCISVAARSTSGKVAISTIPQTSYVKIRNKAKAASKLPNTVWGSRPAGSNQITVYGKCYKSAKPFKVTVHRPASFLGFLVAEKLIGSGIDVKGCIVEKHIADKKSLKQLCTVKTPIMDVVTRCNQDSYGLAAESLVKAVSAKFTKGIVNGEWKHGLKLAADYVRSLGVEDAIVFDDGSGLSRKNKVTANLLTAVLTKIYNSHDRQAFIDTLAVGGVKGSRPIRIYFTQPKYKGKVFAKSGTIDGVKTLSGYARTDDGDYVFAILTNNANGSTRGAINDIVKAIFDAEK